MNIIFFLFWKDNIFFFKNTLALIPGDLQENIKVIYASADEINLSLFGGKSVDAIVAEPFFMYAELPWEE